LSGKVRDVKSSYGKNYVHIDFEGNDDFIASLVAQGKAEVADRSPKSVELKLLGNTLPKEILATASDGADITRFELAEPSLKEIFIMRVGETNALHADEISAKRGAKNTVSLTNGTTP
jgi:ABC-2 type transport system ATP-binding protein